MTDRKKPGVAFWGTVVLVLVMAYPLSFGPACWLYSRSESLEIWETSDRIYYPILWACWHAPEPVGDAIDWYMNVGAAFELCAGKDADGRLSIVIVRLDE
jgi:hypothetical protein